MTKVYRNPIDAELDALERELPELVRRAETVGLIGGCFLTGTALAFAGVAVTWGLVDGPTLVIIGLGFTAATAVYALVGSRHDA